MKIAFYGSSLLSSYWNGAATYYRGLLRDLAARGYTITFYEPDAFDRQKHRDIEAPDWAEVRVYPATEDAVRKAIAEAGRADVVVKASGVGVFDDVLLEGVMAAARPDAIRIFWDVDAPATLAELRGHRDHPLHRALPSLDLVLTYGGGPPVVEAYESFGARRCVPVYNALDPTTHFPVPAEDRFKRRSLVPRQPPARSRGAGRGILPRTCGAAAGTPFPDRRQRLGHEADAVQRARHRPRLHARAQRLQHLARSPSSTSPATAWRRPASRRRRASSRRPAPAPA